MSGWILQSHDDTPIVFRLPTGSIRTIGRTARADFILDAALVSRLHCRLTAENSDQLVVEDLGSTNGTLVNGQRVTRHVIKSGDVLTVGRVEFRVTEGASSGPAGSATGAVGPER
jgi:pSer/pThr/pTyr-binding forkhead associated (FHA) protein